MEMEIGEARWGQEEKKGRGREIIECRKRRADFSGETTEAWQLTD